MEKEIKFVTEKNIRLDEFLRTELPLAVKNDSQKLDFSNSKIRRLILAGVVFVNNRPVLRPAFELRGRSNVLVKFNQERFFYEKQPDDVKFEVTASSVLFEDENLIFINKPANFPLEQTITGNRANLHDSVVDYLWRRSPELRNPPYVGIMHRLDRTTSGAVVFTKNRLANKPLSEIFQNHKLEKKYLAIVCYDKKNESKLKDGSLFSVEMFMGRVSGKSQQGKWGELSESRGGQFSKTDFKILRHINIEGHSCLVIECSLFTGRTHQIRVHLASKNLPILGDTLYGGQKAKRIYLHSELLSFKLGEKEYDIHAPSDFF